MKDRGLRSGVSSQTQMAIAGVAWLAILNFGYEIFVYPVFEYAGFALSAADPKLWLAYAAVVVGSLLIPQTDRPSSFLTLMFFAMFYVPMCSYFAMSGQPYTPFFSMASGYALVCVSLKFFSGRIRLPRIRLGRDRGGKNQRKLIVGVCWALVLTCGIFIAYITGLNSFNLNFLLVYEYRSILASTAYVGIFGYLIGWSSKVALNGLIAHYMLDRNYSMVVITLCAGVVMFGLTSSKQALFDLALVLGIFFIFQRKDRNILFTGALSACSVLILSYSLATNEIVLGSFLFRRAFFVPPFLSFNYFEFFSQNDLVLLSNSIFSYFIENPYEGIAVTHVVGDFLGHPEMGANTSFLASSFMHFGYTGVVIFSVLVGVVLATLDAANGAKRYFPVAIGFSVSPFLSLFVNSSFFTSMLTHGVLFSILMTLAYTSGENRRGS